jgi:hypothetical protein
VFFSIAGNFKQIEGRPKKYGSLRRSMVIGKDRRKCSFSSLVFLRRTSASPNAVGRSDARNSLFDVAALSRNQGRLSRNLKAASSELISGLKKKKYIEVKQSKLPIELTLVPGKRSNVKN